MSLPVRKDDITTRKYLPPKKRYQADVNMEKEGGTEIKREDYQHSGAGSIFPGVIRHTSCPDHCVAYIFKVDPDKSEQKPK